MLDKYPQEIKLVHKNFPLAFHRFAGTAAIAALAANRQGKFWEFHRKLFENHKSLNDVKMQEIARKVGMDLDRFNSDMADPGLQKLVTRDMQEGQRANVHRIPSIFVNGKLLRNQSLLGLEEMIKAELKRRK